MTDEERELLQEDRESWRKFPGPWTGEPDQLVFISPEGLTCAVLRHPRLGHLCGYVGVPKGHPAYGLQHSYMEENFCVHGGITFTNNFRKMDEIPGLDPKLWYFGFDAAHAGDLVPYMDLFRSFLYKDARCATDATDVYRDMAYMKGHVEELSEQVAAFVRPPWPKWLLLKFAYYRGSLRMWWTMQKWRLKARRERALAWAKERINNARDWYEARRNPSDGDQSDRTGPGGDRGEGDN